MVLFYCANHQSLRTVRSYSWIGTVDHAVDIAIIIVRANNCANCIATITINSLLCGFLWCSYYPCTYRLILAQSANTWPRDMHLATRCPLHSQFCHRHCTIEKQRCNVLSQHLQMVYSWPQLSIGNFNHSNWFQHWQTMYGAWTPLMYAPGSRVTLIQ